MSSYNEKLLTASLKVKKPVSSQNIRITAVIIQWRALTYLLSSHNAQGGKTVKGQFNR